MTAHCSVVRNKVYMPACDIQSIHIVREIYANEAAADIFKFKLTLVCFQDLSEGFIRLAVLLHLRARVHLSKASVYTAGVDVVLAQCLARLVELSQKAAHISNAT